MLAIFEPLYGPFEEHFLFAFFVFFADAFLDTYS